MSFKDVNRNQGALVILIKGFSKDQFILNNDNGHAVRLKVSDSKFELVAPTQKKAHDSVLFFAGVLLFLSFLFFTLIKRKRKALNFIPSNA